MQKIGAGVCGLFGGGSEGQPKVCGRQVKKKDKNFYPSLLNPYNGTLFVIMLTFILGGGILLFMHVWWAIVPFVFGFLMIQGFKQPDESPRRVRLVTFLGQKTDVITDSLTLFLDWLPIKIVGYVEFKIEQKDKDFPFKKPIKCLHGYAYGFMSASIVPDENDDDPGIRNPKSGGEKLADFDNAGGNKDDMKSVIEQLDDIFMVWIQHFASRQEVSWMEEHGLELSMVLRPCIKGIMSVEELEKCMPKHLFDDDGKMADTLNALKGSDVINARGLGIDLKKFECIASADPDVIKSRNRFLIEEANRQSEEKNTQTMNRKIASRLALSHRGEVEGMDNVDADPAEKKLSVKDAQTMLLMEDLQQDGAITAVINPGGLNITKTGGKKGNE